ncbi:centromere protein P [Aplochiton taeniatus]
MANSKRLYEAQIKSLQDEIAALQEQHDSSEREMSVQFGGVMQDALLTLAGHKKEKSGKGDTLSLLKAEIKQLERDLSRQTKMNRVDITSSTEGDKVTRSITDLNIVMEGGDFKDFSDFVSRAEESRDLLLFFRTLRRFSERCEDRCRTFKHFRDKYPAVVSLPGGSRSPVMNIRNPLLTGCAILIYWDVQVSSEGVVTPKIDLLVKMPEGALRLDRDRSIEKAPQSFHSLLRLLGPEASIESIILAVC